MSGTSEGGRKAAETIRRVYGPNAAKEWGAMGDKARSTKSYPFKENPALALEAARKGGKLGARHRKITARDRLRDDEWGVLLKMVNRAAGRIKLEGSLTAKAQQEVISKFFEFWEQEDWVSAVEEVCDHPNYPQSLHMTIIDEFNDAKQKAEGASRGSMERSHLRVIRNLKAAFESLGY